ncbi:30S ribosomal protein S12 methylthiotransferase RimO [Christensenellaceae bacterium OttesenSCG-928-L17]|nr:30S ribosomal protein S12 methylthiotransferase RimO [Christensenellaceae bacterium OttesenSCG-928-L17]
MHLNKQPRTVGMVSLGCSKNLVDTERMLGMLRANGFRIVRDARDADILIVNTCGFIESAKQESINTILELAAYKKSGRAKELIVTGCLSERYREALTQELPEVDLFLGVREESALLQHLTGRVCASEKRLLTTPDYSAYLRIADGCDNRCTYCAIPLIRGPLNSVPMEELTREAEVLVSDGVTELTLIAQDTSGYGRDLYGAPKLIPLMEQLSTLQGLHWLRVLYTYPDTVTEDLIAAIAQNEKICRYLDMPLQHCNDEILRRMNRRGSRRHIESVLNYIRKYAPDLILRTTMMVGFPGETEDDFSELLAFLREYPFDRVGAFAFSPEDDTAAANMPGQVDEETKAYRLDALMRQQKDISLHRNASRVGTKTEVLIEGTRGNYTYGRSYAEAPDVDGKILIPHKRAYRPGDYVQVQIQKALEYDLIGEEQ